MHSLHSLHSLKLLFVFLLLAASTLLHAADSGRPNILFILADDLGWKDTAVTGSSFYQTPAIDALAASGMRFTDAYATPLCSPSRGAVLTGRQPSRFQMHAAITRVSAQDPKLPSSDEPFKKVVTPESRAYLPGKEITIAEILKNNGYETWFLGKWHLGFGAHSPDQQGFEHVVCAGGAGAGYFSPYKFLPSLKPGPEGEYLPERLTEETIQILKNRTKDSPPFFIALWHFNVHSPYQAKADVIEKYEQQVDPENPQRNPIMGAMIEGLDDSVGRVMDTLKELGLDDNTLVVFVSDNGGVGFSEGFDPDRLPATSNAPLRGWKGTILEGGIRVPMIVRWPGITRAGSLSKQPVHLCDLFPTMAKAAHAQLPDDLEIDGTDIRPILEGKAFEREQALTWHFPMAFIPNEARPASAIRRGDYKLIRFYGEGPDRTPNHELYNLSIDPEESNDLAKQQPERVQQLAAELDQVLAKTDAMIPIQNPAYDPKAQMPQRWRQLMLHP